MNKDLQSYKDLQKAFNKNERYKNPLRAREKILYELKCFITQAENADFYQIDIDTTIKQTKQRLGYFIDIRCLGKTSMRDALTGCYEQALIYFNDLRGAK